MATFVQIVARLSLLILLFNVLVVTRGLHQAPPFVHSVVSHSNQALTKDRHHHTSRPFLLNLRYHSKAMWGNMCLVRLVVLPQ
jgi:hypothetical protein